MKGQRIDMLCTKFGKNRKKGIGTVANNLKLTSDLEVTLTFDIAKIQQDGRNAHTLKHVHTIFDKAMFDSL